MTVEVRFLGAHWPACTPEPDRARLSQSLRPLGRHQRGAFAVSCAQRLAACFPDSPTVQQEPPDDLRLARQVLAELWTAAVTAIPERLEPLVTELERMPELLLGVLLYGYCLEVRSSRQLERRLHEDLAFRVLAANQTPDQVTIARFRGRPKQALAGFLVESLKLCAAAGMVRVGTVALDGTELAAGETSHTSHSP